MAKCLLATQIQLEIVERASFADEGVFLDLIENMPTDAWQSALATLVCMSFVCAIFMFSFYPVMVASAIIASIMTGELLLVRRVLSARYILINMYDKNVAKTATINIIRERSFLTVCPAKNRSLYFEILSSLFIIKNFFCANANKQANSSYIF